MDPVFKKVYQHQLLSDHDLEEIASSHEYIEIPKQTIILKQGMVADDYYVLQNGVARAFVHDLDNNDITTEFFTDGDLVIVPSSLFQRIPSAENLQTITDCSLWKINLQSFQKLFHEKEGLREWGRLWFSFQLFTMKQRSLDMVSRPAAERYKKLLADKPEVFQNVPLKQIASYLGITDTSLSRIRREVLLRKK